MINARPTLPPAADDPWQRRANRRDAKRKLIALNRAERLAERLGDTERRDDLPPRVLDAHVARLREQYRRLTEIEMEDRDILRPLLEELAETGELSVDQLVSDFGFRLRNGWDSGDETGTD